ncbi:MAG TPA: hypothetical protein VK611_24990 [Acidimicrobiales bacterium]|nr:hypothetical protein [Acidimicrobiales bacterium]
MTSPEPTVGGTPAELTAVPSAPLRRPTWRRFLAAWDRQLDEARELEAGVW